MAVYKASISGLGASLPSKVVSNKDFVDMGLDTNDEWIYSRTGIRFRRIADDGIATSDLALEASKKALKVANVAKDDLDGIILSTSTPDYLAFPSTACVLQSKLGICSNCFAFDLVAACTGFNYAYTSAVAQIESGMAKHILVVCVDILSRILNWSDRSTCILFGDGAGAVVVSPSNLFMTLYTKLYSDGSLNSILKVPVGGTVSPLTKETLLEKKNTITMNGSLVFKLAIKKVVTSVKAALESLDMHTSDISYLIMHQANSRIIDQCRHALGFSEDQVLTNIEYCGNMSAASIPVLLSEYFELNKFKSGDKLLIVGFGSGFTWGVTVIEWML